MSSTRFEYLLLSASSIASLLLPVMITVVVSSITDATIADADNNNNLTRTKLFPLTTGSITTFVSSGSTELSLEFTTALELSVDAFSISKYAEIETATFKLRATALNSDYLTQPLVSIDSEPLWYFPSELGLQTRFETTNSSELSLQFTEDKLTDASANVKLVLDSTITEATFSIELGEAYSERLFVNIDHIQAIDIDGDTLWLGTFGGGVVKLDLTEAQRTVYTAQLQHDGLVSNNINAIVHDTNTVYIATAYGVSRYDKTLGIFKSPNWNTNSFPTYFDSDKINALWIDDEIIYIGAEEGITRYSKTENTFLSKWNSTTCPELISDTIRAIVGDANNIYFGTGKGTMKYIKSSDSWEPLVWQTPNVEPPSPNIPEMIPVNALATDTHIVYIGTHKGVYRFNKTTEVFEPRWNTSSGLLSDDVRSIAVSPDNKYVLVGTTEGVSLFYAGGSSNSATTSTTALMSWSYPQLPSAEVHAIAIRNSVDEIYFGTSRGLARLNLTSDQLEPQFMTTGTTGLIKNRVSELTVDSNILYIGQQALSPYDVGGVSLYHIDSDIYLDHWTQHSGLPSAQVSAIEVDDTYVYIGTANAGIGRYNKLQATFETPWSTATTGGMLQSNKISCIKVDTDYGIVYIATADEGVGRYSKSQNTFLTAWTTATTTGLSSDKITAIAIGSDNVYIGMKPYYDIDLGAFVGGGIAVFARATGTYQFSITTTDGLTDNHVTSLAFDTYTNYLYIGTKKGGVSVWNTLTNTFHTHWNTTSIPQFPSDSIIEIEPTMNHVYIATALGVIRYNKATDNFDLVLNVASGCTSDYPLAIEYYENRLYIGTRDTGLNSCCWYDDGSPYDSEPEFEDQSVYELVYPNSLMVDIGADDDPEWSTTAIATPILNLPDLATAFNQILSNLTSLSTPPPSQSISIMTDNYGNTFCTIPIRISVDTPCKLTLKNLKIKYDYVATVPEFAPVLNSYIETHIGYADWQGNITIPLNISVKSAGKLELFAVEIQYNLKSHPPIAKIDSPTDNSVYTIHDTIYFDGSNSTDPAYDLESYLWISNLTGIIGYSAKFVTNLPAGNHQIILQVTDSIGNSAVASVNLTVIDTNQAPIPRIDSPFSGKIYYEYERIYFDGSNSTDPDGDVIVSYRWSSNIDGILATVPSFYRTLTAGSHIITLEVTDSWGKSATTTIRIEVKSTLIKKFYSKPVTIWVACKELGSRFEIRHLAVIPGAYPENYVGIGIEFAVDTDYQHIIYAYIEADYSGYSLELIQSPADTLRLYYWSPTNNRWIKCEQSGIDTNANYVWANLTITSFDKYNLFAVIGKKREWVVTEKLEVEKVFPEAGATEVSLHPTIRIKFNIGIRLASITRDTFKLIDPDGNEIVCVLQNPDEVVPSTLSFKPAVELSPGVRYTAVLSADYLEAVTGAKLETDYRWSFTTKREVVTRLTEETAIMLSAVVVGAVASVMGILLGIYLYRQHKRRQREEEERRLEAKLSAEASARLARVRARARLTPSSPPPLPPRRPLPLPPPKAPQVEEIEKKPMPSPPITPVEKERKEKEAEEKEEEKVRPIRRKAVRR